MDRVAPSPSRSWSLPIKRWEVGTIACTFALAIVAFLVLYPLWLLMLNSFQVGTYGQATTWGLDNWRIAFTDPSLSSAIGNTITLAVTRQALALVIALPIAWLIARGAVSHRRAEPATSVNRNVTTSAREALTGQNWHTTANRAPTLSTFRAMSWRTRSLRQRANRSDVSSAPA